MDKPWRELPKKDRDWILFTDEQPTVPVYAGYTPAETRRALKRKEEPQLPGHLHRRPQIRAADLRHDPERDDEAAGGAVSVELGLPGLQRQAAQAGGSVGHLRRAWTSRDVSRLPLKDLATCSDPVCRPARRSSRRIIPEKALVVQRIAEDLSARLEVLLDLGLGYLTPERSTPTLSPGELQRLRLATQVRSNLFGVVYVLDEPSAGLHPADTEALLRALDRLKASGNSLFVVEHELDVIRHADWIVDVGPGAGEHGGEILYSGPLPGLADVKAVADATATCSGDREARCGSRVTPNGWLKLRGVTRNNLDRLDVDFPLGVFTTRHRRLRLGEVEPGQPVPRRAPSPTSWVSAGRRGADDDDGLEAPVETLGGEIAGGMDADQAARRGRSEADRPHAAVEPRDLYRAARPRPQAVRRHEAGARQAIRCRPVFVQRREGPCETCQGEGFVCVELLFLPSVYAPCPTCKGARYNAKTLEIKIRDKSIADVLAMTVDAAFEFFADESHCGDRWASCARSGLGYLRLGQPATELSGGEAQRVKLATELQRAQRGETLYVLDEPTTGLHPSDVEKLMTQLQGWSKPETPSSSSSTTCQSRRPATGSSTSDRGPATRGVR